MSLEPRKIVIVVRPPKRKLPSPVEFRHCDDSYGATFKKKTPSTTEGNSSFRLSTALYSQASFKNASWIMFENVERNVSARFLQVVRHLHTGTLQRGPASFRLRMNLHTPSRGRLLRYDGLLACVSSAESSNYSLPRSYPSTVFPARVVRPTGLIADVAASYCLNGAGIGFPLGSVASQGWAKTCLARKEWRRLLHQSSSALSHERGKANHPMTTEKNDDIGIHGRARERNIDPTLSNTQGTGTNRNILQRLPHMPHIHRPTKEELLAAATGFWSRQKIRFKWFSIRSLRPFNTDDISAFFSWVLVGHVIWIIVGTTTFFSLAILAVNTVFAQGKQESTLVEYLSSF